jgi:PAS domain S-box-containing protein
VSLWEEDFSAIKAEIDRVRASGVDDVEQYIRTHPEFVATCVALLRIIDVNQATLRLFGATGKEALTQSLEGIFRPGSLEVFGRLLQALVRGERHHEVEAELQTLNGRRLHVLISVAFPAPGEPLDTVLVSLADITDRKQVENALRQEMDVRTTLARVGESLAGELRSEQLIQSVTDASTKLTEAEFGAFFYNVTDDKGDSYQLYSLAGAPREAFADFPPPRATRVFGPTFRGEGVIRLDDVTKDSRYGQNAPFHGMPPGHLPVRSYLAVPVIGRRGDVLGGLFFGHSQAGVFTERHEQLAAGVAGWAAIALDNARLYQDAEEANRLKDEFLATLSHELRTPLNAVLGWAHMLRQSTMQPALQQRALESLERNARAQAQLVEDLLDVSRIMAGKLQVKGDAVDLALVVTNAVDTVRAGVAAKGLGLNVHLPADRRLLVTGDADRLQQVVWNLVSNAVKFTPAGGRVDVEVRPVDEKAEIVVRDTGQGIDPAFRPFLFQRFRQMDASKTRVHGGLGLGLSIVRHLIEAHGGTVAVDSDGPGRGATFRVVLPLRVPDGDEPKRAEAAVAADQPLLGVRAMVVDDEADARELTRYVLEVRGASVVTSGSAGEALHLLAENAFDILVADIGMPEQDGLSLIRAVRGLPEQAPNREIPAIAVTAYAGVRERDEALAAGFTAHLGKPVDPDQLTVAISACTTRGPQS